MPEFLVEVYVSRADPTGAVPPEDVASVADELTREGSHVRLLRSIFVPEDETCFYLVLAQTSDVVREVARRAGLKFEHVADVAADWSLPPLGGDITAGNGRVDEHGWREHSLRAETARAMTAASAIPRD